MYAGHFNLNTYLRTFVRGDIVDGYEKECLAAVQKYKDTDTKTCLPLMIQDFNNALNNMWLVIKEEIERETL